MPLLTAAFALSLIAAHAAPDASARPREAGGFSESLAAKQPQGNPIADTGRDTAPQTVTLDILFLPTEDGENPFDPIFFNFGSALVKATIANGETLGMIDLSTNRNLVDARFVRDRGGRIGEPIDTIAWRGVEYERSRAYSVEVVLDGQVKITSDISAITIDSQSASALTPAHFVLGRSLVEKMALMILSPGAQESFYGLMPTGNWVTQTDTGLSADFPYSDGTIRLEINGKPLRLFIDLNAPHQLNLTQEAFASLWPETRPRKAEITYGPFTQTVEPEILFDAPMDNIDGSIGLGFLEKKIFVIDGPAKIVHITSFKDARPSKD